MFLFKTQADDISANYKKHDSYAKQCDSIEEAISKHISFLTRHITITDESSEDENDHVFVEDNEVGRTDTPDSRTPVVTTANNNHLNNNTSGNEITKIWLIK